MLGDGFNVSTTQAYIDVGYSDKRIAPTTITDINLASLSLYGNTGSGDQLHHQHRQFQHRAEGLLMLPTRGLRPRAGA